MTAGILQKTPCAATFWLGAFYFILLAFPCLAHSQTTRQTPYFSAESTTQQHQLAEQTAASVRNVFQPPSRFDKATKEDYLKKREKIATDIAAEIKNYAIADDVIWPFLQKIHAKIVAANPTMKDTRVLLVADPTPNAYCIGEGTFVVHVGLLAGLENEDQVAFVLCHEMAHYAYQHATKGLETTVEQLNSKAFKAKIKELEAKEYNRYEQMEAVLKNMLFNSRYHSRNHERQSDSLAYHFFVRTQFNHTQAKRLMEVFEHIDEPLRDTVLDIKTNFGCTQHPFQELWTTNASGSVWDAAHEAQVQANKAFRDSVSTHPDWEERLLWLQPLVDKITPTPQPAEQPTIDYATIRYLAAIESVESWANFGRFDKVLFLATQYQRVYPKGLYFQEVKTLALYQLYQHAKDHDLATVLAQSSYSRPEKYNHFLDFLNNLRMKELLALAECSLTQLPNDKGEYGLLAAYQLAKAKEDRATANTTKKEYLSRFKNGRFVDYFKE